MNSTTQVRIAFRYIGAIFLVTLLFSIWHFGKSTPYTFSANDKVEVEGIAKSICIAAGERDCKVTWGGKHKWSGSLIPVAKGQAIAGIDHIRSTLAPPTWVESNATNGVLFSDGKHDVFFSTDTGTISITSQLHPQ